MDTNVDTHQEQPAPREKPAPRRILGLTMAQLQLLVIGVAMMVPPVVFLLIILFINFGR